MPTLEILALGWPELDWAPFGAARNDIFRGDAAVESRIHIPNRLELADVLRVELLISRVPNDLGQHGKFVKFLTHVVDNYPYLPVVVVGSAGTLGSAFHAVKAARYLPADVTTKHLATEAARAIGGAWWYGVQAFDDPLVVVDRKGRIVRANPAARKRFGAAVVGQHYLPTVEKRSEQGWPPGHPVAAVLGVKTPVPGPGRPAVRGWPAPKGESCYWEFPEFGDYAERAQLVCIPVLGFRNQVRAVCVLVVEMTRWVRIFHAASFLAQATNIADLCQRIVEAIHDPKTGLGYERVRLYIHDANRRVLKGKASRGFHQLGDQAFLEETGVDRETYFRTQFEYSVDRDQPTAKLERLHFPILCIATDQASSVVGSPDVTDSAEHPRLVQFYVRRQFDWELDGPVTRWVDVPLMIPRGAGDVPRFWGKLSIDRKSYDNNGNVIDKSHELTIRDVADLTMFASVAAGAIAGAIASRERVQIEEGLDRFAATGKALSRLDGEDPHESSLKSGSEKSTGPSAQPTWSQAPPGTRVVLQLFLQLTDAEVVYFRGNHRVRLSVEQDGEGSLVEWRGGAQPPDFDVPPDIDLADHYSADLLTRIGNDGRWQSDIPPKPESFNGLLMPDWEARKALVRGRHPEWSLAQARFLDWPHEVYVPVVIDGKFQGAFVAVARYPLPGADSRAGWLLSVFSGAAGPWYELGVRKSEQAWWRPTLTELLSSLPDVIRQLGKKWPNDPLENPFRHRLVYAGLAAMLTAHTGIGWNRCFILRVNELRTAAELVHAVGGFGEPEHEDRMAVVRARRPSKLGSVVGPLLREPEPRDPDTQVLDPLYDLCVNQAWGEGKPITLRLDVNSGLLELLRQDPTSGATMPGFRVFDPRVDEWCREQERWFQARRTGPTPSGGEVQSLPYPRVFAAAEMYAFALWGTFENLDRRPIALILVDMAYRPHESVSARVPATSLFLNAVADKMAAYDHFVVEYVSAAAEYVLHHGHDLGSRWEELLKALREATIVIPEAAVFDKEIEKLREAMTKVKGHATDREYDARTSVPEALEGLRKKWDGQILEEKIVNFSLTRDGDATDNLSIACPGEVLTQAVDELVTNAARFVREGERKVTIEVTFRSRECRLRKDHRTVVEIDVRDRGTGIDEPQIHDIFITGATVRLDGARGRGLAQILRNSTVHGGYLYVYHPGRTDDPQECGAGFRLVFYAAK